MPRTQKCARMNTKDGYIVCPNCGKHTTQVVYPQTRAEYLHIWCRYCKAEYIVNIADGQCSLCSRCR